VWKNIFGGSTKVSEHLPTAGVTSMLRGVRMVTHRELDGIGEKIVLL
jgi:hypothetical protein